jgi:hypothetical protein
MPTQPLLDAIPIWLLFVLTVAVILLAIETGYRVAVLRSRRGARDREAPIGEIVGALLGLLAFILAFTFGLSANRFDNRRELLLKEVNAIGTCYLRTAFVPTPYRDDLRQLLRQYVDARLMVTNMASVGEVIATSEELQGTMWQTAVDAMRSLSPKTDQTMPGLFIDALNEMIDLHRARVVVGVRYRIATVIWCMLYFVAIVATCAMGYGAGLKGSRSMIGNVLLALTFSAVIWLIADLDRAHEGFIAVSQQPLVELHDKMATPAMTP